ncbi:MAG: hypothetical protein J6C57_07390 [Paludibacteraceae bacterium]|nr:hypothetical protein [Paludibacteraceae bacterium]
MSMIGIPNIPDFKGLVTSGSNALIGLGGAAIIRAIFGNVWGLVNEFGVPVVLADNVLGLSFQSASTIVNAPIEGGSFASYNKIATPSQAVVQMSKGSGGALQRGAFLAQLLALEGSTLKFYVISPEFVHRNMCITNVDYARSAQEGVQLIVVNVSLEEVREVKVNYSFEEVEAPSDAKAVDGGSVQPKDAAGASWIRQGRDFIGSRFGV